MAGAAARFLRGKNAQTIAIAPRTTDDPARVAQTVMAGALMGLFDPDKYRTKDREQRELKSVTVAIAGADKKEIQRGAERGRIIGESINFTRDLANEPASRTPSRLPSDQVEQI